MLAKALEHGASQAKLNGAPRDGSAVGTMIGIPLQAHLGAGHRRPPVVASGVIGLVEAGRDRLGQNAVEEFATQPEAENDLLTLLGAPAGSIHHPQEIRLDPAHARIGEVASERAMLDGKLPDRWPIGLIHDDRARIIVGEDVPAVGRPLGNLTDIQLSWKIHDHPVLPGLGSRKCRLVARADAISMRSAVRLVAMWGAGAIPSPP